MIELLVSRINCRRMSFLGIFLSRTGEERKGSQIIIVTLDMTLLHIEVKKETNERDWERKGLAVCNEIANELALLGITKQKCGTSAPVRKQDAHFLALLGCPNACNHWGNSVVGANNYVNVYKCVQLNISRIL